MSTKATHHRRLAIRKHSPVTPERSSGRRGHHMARRYSHIVIGAGSLGSAPAYRLARAGATDVLVLEQFALGHGRGGSDDHSRLIRHA